MSTKGTFASSAIVNEDVVRERVAILFSSFSHPLEDLAPILNLSKSTIYRINSKQVTPTFDSICRISEYFHVSINWICGLTEEKYLREKVPDIVYVYRGLDKVDRLIVDTIASKYINRIDNSTSEKYLLDNKDLLPNEAENEGGDENG